MSNFGKEPRLNFEQHAETPGRELEGYVVEFIECNAEEVGCVFENVEHTKKDGVNDNHHIDAFITLKGGLECAVDFSDKIRRNGGEGAERIGRKKEIQKIISFQSRRDEATGKVISEPMPHFIVDGLSMERWLEWGREANDQGVPITDVMPDNRRQEQERFILGKMWEQAHEIYRNGTMEQRKKIIPYIETMKEEFKRILNNQEFEAFLNAA